VARDRELCTKAENDRSGQVARIPLTSGRCGSRSDVLDKLFATTAAVLALFTSTSGVIHFDTAPNRNVLIHYVAASRTKAHRRV